MYIETLTVYKIDGLFKAGLATCIYDKLDFIFYNYSLIPAVQYLPSPYTYRAYARCLVCQDICYIEFNQAKEETIYYLSI